ncbi:flagellar hook-associated protein FlgL [Agarilytica rhodophyticola]|uniref:flagellar hook-associated protein FlgL n=1 Tax=Agarilytica rhodophyticola TaxID=1737490 RepID=UPI000B34926D|nr:flagellar hook-associated protein FlgL [Agarilytica rhodophyticola]
MRISSNQIFNIANDSIGLANQAVVKTQQQLSTGRRVLNPSDDPVASTKILAINKELADVTQFERNINTAKNNMVLEESILTGVNNIIVRMQELAVQAANTATLSENEYIALSNEVDSRLEELTNLLNSQNSNGDYIFAGYKSTTAPFVGGANSGFNYLGDEGQQFIKIANNTTVAASDSGKEIFVDIESARNTIFTVANSSNRSEPAAEISIGQVIDQDVYDDFYPEDIVITFNQDNTIAPPGKNFTARERSTDRIIVANQPYVQGNEIQIQGVSFRISGNPASATPTERGDQFFIESTQKQDILTTVARFSEAMKIYDGTDEGRETLSDAVANTIDNLSNAQTSVLETVAELGARFNTLDSTEQLHLDSKLISQELLSSLRDIDYAEAAARLSSQTLILEAAQASFVRVTRLTLFSQL